jgi:hypothetical protein
VLAQPSERLAIALEEPIEQKPPTRVAQRPEHRILGVHGPTIRD